MQERQGKRELVCDHACAFNIGVHILIEKYNSSCLLLSFLHGGGSIQPKKRGRGTVKGLAVTIKRVKERSQILPIEFSERRGGPIGPNRRAFVDEVVLFTRKWAPLIGVKSWKYIKEEVKEQISEEILVHCVLFYS
jgi:hypothetical protein